MGGTGADILLGGDGADQLNGGGGSDTLNGGSGDDQLSGGPGGDLYLLRNDGGDDVIVDFAPGADRIDISDFGFVDFQAVVGAADEQAGDTVLRLDDNDSVTLTGLKIADLGADDFLLW